MALLKSLPWLAGLALIAACAREPTRISLEQRYLAVHSVVETHARTASVLLTWNDPSGQVHPAAGANVYLVRNAERWRLHPSAEDTCAALADGLRPGCYSVDFGQPLQPGDRIALVIESAEGVDVEGSAVLPPSLVMSQPQAGTAIPLTCSPGPICQPSDRGGTVGAVPVTFRAAPELRRIEMTVTARYPYHDGQRLNDAACIITPLPSGAIDPAVHDSAMLHLMQIHCVNPSGNAIEWDSVAADLHVIAYDSVYARYRATVDALRTGRPDEMAAGIRGAVGVFAGAVSTVVPISLRRSGAAAVSAGPL